MSDSSETTQTYVKTYVPAYQKDEWKAHADRLNMTQSEFVRTMVQAGRRGFDPSEEETSSEGATPGGRDLETRVLELLSADTYSWEQLLEAISDDLETRLEEILADLQEENRIQYSGRAGGYTIVGETNAD